MLVSSYSSYLVEHDKVHFIERHLELVEVARKNQDRLEICNVKIILNDGSLGFPEKSSFDRIIITAVCKKIPETSLEQLSIEGLLILRWEIITVTSFTRKDTSKNCEN